MGTTSMERLITSERYLRLRNSLSATDFAVRRRIFEEAIAETEGSERALWLILRAEILLTLPAPAVDSVRADLDAALALAPDDPDVINGAALTLVVVVLETQRLSELGVGRSLVPKAARIATEKWQLLYPLGVLDWVRGRHRTAERHFARTLDEMAGWGPERIRVWAGRRFLTHCYHGLVALELDEVEALERDVQAAEALYQGVNQAYVTDRPLALAKAGLAICRGDTQAARRELQTIWAKEREEKYTRDPQHIKAEMDLMAARIAAAEGRPAAVEHFCRLAQERAERHNLPMTLRRIARLRERLLDGAAV